MFTLRRWWDKNALKAGLVFLAIGTALGIRQTNGALVSEAYQLVSRPFQPSEVTEQRLETAYVLELQERVVELENQNQKLRELIDYDKNSKLETTTLAAVIGRSADHWWQHITVNKGTSNNVKKGDVATGPGGLVGRVIEVTPNTARILLVTDPTSQIGVKVSSSRSTGYIQGETDSQATMQFFEKAPVVKAGDVVVTSSFSRLFPQDIPVGRVASVDMSHSPAPKALFSFRCR